MGDISKIVQSRRGQLLEVNQEETSLVAKAKMPVAEMFGLADVLRSGTEGRGTWSLQDSAFEKLPSSLQADVVKKIRDRKGLTPEQK
jgi:elongation factor 2